MRLTPAPSPAARRRPRASFHPGEQSGRPFRAQPPSAPRARRPAPLAPSAGRPRRAWRPHSTAGPLSNGLNRDRAIRAAVAHLGTTLAARPDDARLAGPVRRLRAGRGEPAALWEAHDVTVRRSFSSNNGALSRNTQAAAPRPPYTPRCFHHRRGGGGP
ncbi:hypothetical protein ACFV4E_34530 [Streptomyces hygroscopicus]|uniref:MmyB family transcriptional regulator n=1 Tax=Streptomyces hygroscopicus TaxID=1912 RepID=UPI0036896F5C